MPPITYAMRFAMFCPRFLLRLRNKILLPGSVTTISYVPGSAYRSLPRAPGPLRPTHEWASQVTRPIRCHDVLAISTTTNDLSHEINGAAASRKCPRAKLRHLGAA